MKKMLAKNAEIKSHNMDETARFQQISEKKVCFYKRSCISKILRTRDAKKAFCGRSKIALTEITSRTTDCFIAALERCGAIAQLGERLNGIQEVSGSIPLISTKTDHKVKVLWFCSTQKKNEKSDAWTERPWANFKIEVHSVPFSFFGRIFLFIMEKHNPSLTLSNQKES